MSGRGPLASLIELRERMNQLFDELVHPTESGGALVAHCPPADVFETPDAFVICLDLAGVSPDDVQIELAPEAPGRVTVRGHRPFPGESCEAVHRIERRTGPFARTFDLPAPIVPDTIERAADDGVLRLTLRRVLGT